MIYIELIYSTGDKETLRSAVTYKTHTSLTIFYCLQTFKSNSVNSINCIRPPHHYEIKHQKEVILISCAMGTHGLQPEV